MEAEKESKVVVDRGDGRRILAESTCATIITASNSIEQV